MASNVAFPLCDTVCVICRLEIEFNERRTWSNVRDEGYKSLLHYSSLRNDHELNLYLIENPSTIKVHDRCRKHYTCKRKYEQEQRVASQRDTETVPVKSLRSAVDEEFNWKEHCLFCEKPAKFDKKHPNKNKVSHVETFEIGSTIKQRCSKRCDTWGVEVQSRLNTCNDLMAVEAVYHRSCYAAFGALRAHPFRESSAKPGGKVCEARSDAFETLCSWIELCDDELYTMTDLHNKLGEIAFGDENQVYSKQYLKRKLKEKYSDHIFFADVAGKHDVVCFRDMAACIINDKWYSQQKADIEDEKLRVVIAAAKLIKDQIREMKCDMNKYPLTTDFNNVETSRQWVPTLLNALMQHIICDNRKQVALSHCIVQAARPRSVIAPILLGLGVSLDHTFGSEWLTCTLGRLGMSVSYDEVNRYKQSVMQSDVDDLPLSFPSAFTQFSGDNVDHQTVTLDGTGTFHGMGVISMTTPCSKITDGQFSTPTLTAIARLKRVPVGCVIQNKGIPILSYTTPGNTALSVFKLKPLDEVLQLLPSFSASRPVLSLDLIWHSGYFFQEECGSRPGWSGYMQDVSGSVSGDSFHPVSDIRMLPIINLNPNDMSCVYSTLLFVETQAKILNMQTACITFDQPLYIKSVEISRSAGLNVVCRLGGFHLLMNYMGAIGTIMSGSGLAEALGTSYGPVTITHMMTGKAYSKALHGHCLVESALMVLLFEKLFGIASDNDDKVSPLDPKDIDDLKQLYAEISNQSFDCTDSAVPQCFQHLHEQISAYKDKLIKDDRTAKLWVQYLESVTVIKKFFRAERTSDWGLHLMTVSQMLNLLAAAGHTNYAKCARIYLQLMTELPVTHPWLHNQLNSGRHAVRRSDRHWAAISTDLAIEQVMMRSVKSRGGLTHGRGLTETVRLTWIQTMHLCAGIHAALTSLTDLEHSTSDNQHVELGQSRLERDNKDLSKLIDWFRASNPFSCTDSRLHSLATGLVATDEDGINCDSAENVGARIQSKMNNMAFTDVTLKKADRARTLQEMSGKVFPLTGTKRLPVDSTVLFSRLLIVIQREPEICGMFKYELTAVPTAFFKGELLRKTDKSQLAKELSLNVVSGNTVSGSRIVVDGGWLLHKVKWLPGGSYADVAAQYVSFVGKHFGTRAVIVFDGYECGPTVKDHEHGRRAEKSCPDVLFDSQKPAHKNQSAFLSNSHNKAKLVRFLSSTFSDRGYTVRQAVDDADTLIVAEALQLAHNMQVTVVANDTDIMVLLVYHFNSSLHDMYLHSEVSTKNSSRTNVLSIRDIRANIGENAARQLLVVHALSGCDSTSCLYGHGKASVWKKITGNADTVPLTDVIESLEASHELVADAGLKLLALIYGGKLTDSLNHLRYARYMEITASALAPLRPERLPPTENAARFHAFRTHIQVVQWKSLMTAAIDPTDWGWKLFDGHYVPIATDLEAAPPNLLSVMRCKCKMETKHPCSSQHCTCVKNGLPCVAACKHCKGCDCENPGVVVQVSDDTDTDEILQEQIEPIDLFDNMSDDGMELTMPWLSEEVV